MAIEKPCDGQFELGLWQNEVFRIEWNIVVLCLGEKALENYISLFT